MRANVTSHKKKDMPRRMGTGKETAATHDWKFGKEDE